MLFRQQFDELSVNVKRSGTRETNVGLQVRSSMSRLDSLSVYLDSRVYRLVNYLLRASSVVSLVLFVGCAKFELDEQARYLIELFSETETYDGAWFKIRYPRGYSVRPSLKSISAAGYDSVFFTAPDREIRLYICSPQWNRKTPDISIQPLEKEELTSKVVVKHPGEPKETTQILIQSFSGERVRFYERTESVDGQIGWTVGIEAPSSLDYREILLQFKGTLTQYAD